MEKISLTPEQLKEAKRLQTNVFKTFNKVDEKSQLYSENIEAMGTLVQQAFAFISSIIAMGFTISNITKLSKNPQMVKNTSLITAALKPFAFAILPIIAIDVITTKMQKKASRVADMLALNEMSDYRNYVDYSQFDTKFLQNK